MTVIERARVRTDVKWKYKHASCTPNCKQCCVCVRVFVFTLQVVHADSQATMDFGCGHNLITVTPRHKDTQSWGIGIGEGTRYCQSGSLTSSSASTNLSTVSASRLRPAQLLEFIMLRCTHAEELGKNHSANETRCRFKPSIGDPLGALLEVAQNLSHRHTTLHKEERNMNLVCATQTVWCSHHHHGQAPSQEHTFNTNSREQTVSHWRKTYFMFFSNEEEQEFSEWFAPLLKVQVQAFPSKTHAWSPYGIIPEIYHKLWSPGGRRDLRTFSCAWRNTAM